MVEQFELRKSIHSPILHGTIYKPKTVKGVILFIHDVNENRGRYPGLASFFNERGYAFVCYDLRGHYQSFINDLKGHFGDDKGSELLFEDAHTILDLVKERFPNLPITLMGHGFGAHLAKLLFNEKVNSFEQLVLVNPLSLPKGSKAREKALDLMTYRKPRLKKRSLNSWMGVAFNERDEQLRYAFLSNNKNIVNKYISDPYCGYSLTQRAIRDALKIMNKSDESQINSSHKAVNVVILGGKENPLTHYGRDLVSLKRAFVSAGYESTQLSIFDGLKHDILLELNNVPQLRDTLDQICRRRNYESV